MWPINHHRLVPVFLAAFTLIAAGCSSTESAGISSTPNGSENWGPLAVVSGGDASDAALILGTLSITEECVYLDEQGESVLLVWPDSLVTWNADRKSITFGSGSSVHELGSGDSLRLGGGGSSVAESGQSFSESFSSIEWINEPDASCSAETVWFVGAVVDANATEAQRDPQPGVLFVPDCPDTADCAAGFVLDEAFYELDCSAIRNEMVTEEQIGEGDFFGKYVTVNLVEGIDPELLVAVSLPSRCVDYATVASDWSVAIRGSNEPEVRKAICAISYMTQDQQIANGCVEAQPVIRILTDAEIAEADEVIGEFLQFVFSNDEAGAVGMWTGYPLNESGKDAAIREFLADQSWIRSVDDIGWRVMPGAGAGRSIVVTVASHNDGGHAVAFVLSPSSSDSPAIIQRLPSPEPSWSRDGRTVTFDAIPVEGGARAFFNGVELEDVEVNHDTITTSVVLPEDLPELGFLTVSFATPELPTATAVVLRN